MAPDFSHGLSLQMSQRLEMVMTPQMIQSMEMLQLPMLALEQRIQQELLENPALEMVDIGPEPDGPEAVAEDYDSAPAEAEDANNDLRKVDEIDYDWDNYYDESAPRRGGGDEDDEFDPIENAAQRPMAFLDYLEQQLGYMELDERERRIVTRILYNLDDAGYLHVPLAETVDPEEMPPPTGDELEDALDVVQHLDPPGVGARDARECLLLQLDRLGGLHVFERVLVENHLEDLAANRLPQIAKAMECDIEDVKTAAHFIRTLNPHPGLDYGKSGITHVQPDVIAEMDDDDEWQVRLSGGSQPDISDMFLALFDTTKRGKQLREEITSDPERASEFKQMQELLKHGEHGRMLREKYQSARWLVTAIAQRERTLLRVSKEIVDAQRAFLSGQTDAPAPLMMQEIADKVGIDISTVSRAVRDKYIHTPIGVKPLRMFFTRAVGGSDGNSAKSNVHIMNRVREIIEGEDKSKPLKDDEIQKLLADDGIDIKRRTVAKYRSNLGFPNHSQRKEY